MKALVKRLQHRFFPPLLAYSAKWFLKAILATCRFKVIGIEVFSQTAVSEKCIVMLWHNRLVLMAEFLRRFAPQFNYAALISQSRDAEPLAIIANSYSFGKALRVPHNERLGALRRLIHHLKSQDDIILITPDGPRGPRYQIKPGITIAARETGASVFPLTWTASRFWQLKTWDQLIIPKPFSTIHVSIGAPITLDKSAQQTIEEDSKLLKMALDQIATENETFV